MIFSENRCPPPIESGGGLFREHALATAIARFLHLGLLALAIFIVGFSVAAADRNDAARTSHRYVNAPAGDIRAAAEAGLRLAPQTGIAWDADEAFTRLAGACRVTEPDRQDERQRNAKSRNSWQHRLMSVEG